MIVRSILVGQPVMWDRLCWYQYLPRFASFSLNIWTLEINKLSEIAIWENIKSMFFIHFRTEISGDFSFECLERLKPDRKGSLYKLQYQLKTLFFIFTFLNWLKQYRQCVNFLFKLGIRILKTLLINTYLYNSFWLPLNWW